MKKEPRQTWALFSFSFTAEVNIAVVISDLRLVQMNSSRCGKLFLDFITSANKQEEQLLIKIKPTANVNFKKLFGAFLSYSLLKELGIVCRVFPFYPGSRVKFSVRLVRLRENDLLRVTQ